MQSGSLPKMIDAVVPTVGPFNRVTHPKPLGVHGENVVFGIGASRREYGPRVSLAVCRCGHHPAQYVLRRYARGGRTLQPHGGTIASRCQSGKCLPRMAAVNHAPA